MKLKVYRVSARLSMQDLDIPEEIEMVFVFSLSNLAIEITAFFNQQFHFKKISNNCEICFCSCFR